MNTNNKDIKCCDNSVNTIIPNTNMRVTIIFKIFMLMK